MHGFTPSSLLLLLVAGAGLSSAAPIGLVLPEAAAVAIVPAGAQVQAAAASSSASSATAALPPSSVAQAPTSATASASASSATPASSVAPAGSSAPASSSKPTASASAPVPSPTLCAGVVEWTGAVYLDNDDSSVDTRMTMKTRCPPGAKSITLTVVDTSTCAPLTSTTRNLGFKTLEANVYDSNLKTLSEGRSDDGKAVTLSCTDTDSISLVAIFHGPKRVMSEALTFTAPKVQTV